MGWPSQGRPTTHPRSQRIRCASARSTGRRPVRPLGRRCAPASRPRRPAAVRGARTTRWRPPPRPGRLRRQHALTSTSSQRQRRRAGRGRSRRARRPRRPARSASACSQVTRTDFSPGAPMVGTPPAAVTISGTQWPGAKGGSVHSSSSTRGDAHRRAAQRPASRTASSRARSEATRRSDLCLVAGGRPERGDRVEHLLERVRVDGQHLGGAAEVGQRVVDDRDVDRADRAQVLGDHQIGVEARQGALVEVVEVLAGAHRGRHERVDLRGVEPLGQGAGRDDAAFAGLGAGSRTRRSPRRRRRRHRSRRGSRSSTAAGRRSACTDRAKASEGG